MLLVKEYPGLLNIVPDFVALLEGALAGKRPAHTVFERRGRRDGQSRKNERGPTDSVKVKLARWNVEGWPQVCST